MRCTLNGSKKFIELKHRSILYVGKTCKSDDKIRMIPMEIMKSHHLMGKTPNVKRVSIFTSYKICNSKKLKIFNSTLRNIQLKILKCDDQHEMKLINRPILIYFIVMLNAAALSAQSRESHQKQ